MTPEEYIASQPVERSALLNELHQIIITNDSTVSFSVGTMMRSEMVLYCQTGAFKYALASGKQYMSLHVFPMYCRPEIHDRYKFLLHDATFQKSCINFSKREQIPLDIISQLIKDCADIDVKAIMEAYKSSKK
ncbi:DUF1801 domain-containing protein [Mucilaginibacter celer]|uniref:DUF1801 domain-containing protein n=1 Tax=Mucilaginibacter celer TaxID=2305508 RepID=A0A494W245_9SPHI|nr:DUF1801 domain-containing protein [Mucilaginibacter celer]AYL97618.1 DUF1801 domain-containing protein [Mucilaginibacter celer]